MPKLLYRSDAGFSGLQRQEHRNSWIARLRTFWRRQRRGDNLAERYTGIIARYEDKHLSTDLRIRFRLDFESYRDQWSASTTTALEQPGSASDTSGIYRTRQNIEPCW